MPPCVSTASFAFPIPPFKISRESLDPQFYFPKLIFSHIIFSNYTDVFLKYLLTDSYLACDKYQPLNHLKLIVIDFVYNYKC